MGGFGRCCCTCECLPIEDLPTVTISGWTGNGWSGTCCYEQKFTPNTTPSWSKACSGMLYEGSVSETCVTHHWKQYTPDYRGYEYFPNGCDNIPEDYCCPGNGEHIATTTTDWTFTNNAFLAVWARPKEIYVRISQEDVDCEGVEGESGGCKIVIRSRYVYEYKSKIYKNDLSSVEQEVSIVNTDCFEANPAYTFNVPASSAITCSDVPSSPPSVSIGACVYEGLFQFDRVKYYDDMPSGEVQFQNDDVPGCDSSACDYSPYSYVNQVCIFGPSGPIDNSNCLFEEPCYCTETIETRDIDVTGESPTCIGESVTEKGDCFANPCLPMSCQTLVTICINPGDPPLFEYECPVPSSVSVIGFIPPLCGQPGVGNDGYMGPSEPTPGKYVGCGGCAPTADGTNLCYPQNAQQTETEYPYLETSDCFSGNCNPDCCRFYDDCPCCDPEGTCLPLFGQAYSTVSSHTRSQSCSGLQSASVCTSAPSWTITLA